MHTDVTVVTKQSLIKIVLNEVKDNKTLLTDKLNENFGQLNTSLNITSLLLLPGEKPEAEK